MQNLRRSAATCVIIVVVNLAEGAAWPHNFFADHLHFIRTNCREGQTCKHQPRRATKIDWRHFCCLYSLYRHVENTPRDEESRQGLSHGGLVLHDEQTIIVARNRFLQG